MAFACVSPQLNSTREYLSGAKNPAFSQCFHTVWHWYRNRVLYASRVPQRQYGSARGHGQECRPGRLDIYGAGSRCAADNRPVDDPPSGYISRLKLVSMVNVAFRFDRPCLAAPRRDRNKNTVRAQQRRKTRRAGTLDANMDRPRSAGVYRHRGAVRADGREIRRDQLIAWMTGREVTRLTATRLAACHPSRES